VELALRNGRQVIPINSAFKRKIKGIVHDQSATGQTVYLEPEEIFEINNEIRELELEERREIVKILKALTDTIRPWLPILEESYEKLGIIDFTRAKALLAIDMVAQKPRLTNGTILKWVKAIHPLLFLSHKQQGKQVEPLTIDLDKNTRVLVISGPNAGGKSVALKTCGLLQYMIQCGLLVPMESYSEVGIFDSIFIDIGDQQSIENDLSTYSSHLLNMSHFLKNCTETTLFLIDELGAGTEPRIGGAIAEAILEEISSKGSFGIVTTHYANLKLMAGKYDGIINGSMLFDTTKMKPLYRLKMGNPGSSFAFEIAKSIGLHYEVLKKAEENAGVQDIDFDRQLQDLDLKKTELDDKEKQLKAADNFLSEIIDKYEKLNNDLETRKAEIMHQARLEAKKLLADSNRIIENTIRQIKEAQADKKTTQQAREELTLFAKNQDEQKVHPKPKPKEKKETIFVPDSTSSPFINGDMVRIKGQENIGEIFEINEKEAILLFGNMKMKAKLTAIERVKKKLVDKDKGQVRVKTNFDINEKAANFNPQIDIMGLRVDEALSLLRNYIDDATLLGAKQVKIMHGKGDGILREAARQWLKTLAEVHRFRDEHPDRGGSGATIVDFK
jgi:DNA mismatch repair protein MutS2